MEAIVAIESGAETQMKDESPSGIVGRWERFLPRMMLRVLLVEADDSTRQIIAALLRKCGYKVAAVSDGLKAWELLKGRPKTIDLILTEMELPSISGFALLTLVMVHDICKNIPVIMISSQDCISTVYKCMMRGASDYLVKPIRRNELRNLWQHVWRRQSSIAGRNRPQERVSETKVEVTSENDAASNHCHKAYIEKGNEAQSSCTKPDVESESTRAENTKESPPVNVDRSFSGPLKLQGDETDLRHRSLMHENEAGGAEAESHDTGDGAYANANNFTIVSSSRNTTDDLIGAFADYPEYNHRNSSSSNCTSNFDNSSQLDLSLRRCHPSELEDSLMAERHTLRQSNASAFSRYTQRPNVTNPDKNLFGIAKGYVSHIPDPRLSMQQSSVSPTSAHSDQIKTVQVKGVRISDRDSGNGSVLCPIFCAQSGLSPIQNPSNSFYHSNLEKVNSDKLLEHLHRNSNKPRENQGQMFDSCEDHGRISLATDHSASVVARRLYGLGYGSTSGSNFDINQVPVATSIANSEKEEVDIHSVKDLCRSTEREAALNKFRLKRKDRCYEKKVRYESRKKLAEQRPRVKGQFVRQLHVDPPPQEGNGN